MSDKLAFGGIAADQTLVSGLNLPTFDPGIYNGCTLESIVLTKQQAKDGQSEDELKNLIQISILNAQKQKHVETLWEPLESDDKFLSKANTLSTQLAHVVEVITGDRSFAAKGYASFAEFTAVVLKLINEQLEKGNTKTFTLKIVANNYNNKPRVQFSYVPFMYPESSPGKPVEVPKFTAKEASDLAIYKKLMNGEAPASSDPLGGVTDMTGKSAGAPF